jgi:periplasmic divalent cation tolerance protein
MVSIYRRQGNVERDSERQMVIKTTRHRIAPLQTRLRELHAYELPEFVVVAVEGASGEYLRWVVEQTEL